MENQGSFWPAFGLSGSPHDVEWVGKTEQTDELTDLISWTMTKNKPDFEQVTAEKFNT